MSLSKFEKGTSAIEKFVDRKTPIEVFRNTFNDFYTGKLSLKVLVFYGVGGIGKTTLLNYLKNQLMNKIDMKKVEKVKPIFVNLETYEFNSPVDVLICISKQVKGPCILFKYALLKYWSLLGYSHSSDVGKNNTVREVIKSLERILKIPIPTLGLLEEAVDKARIEILKLNKKYRDKLNEIDKLETIREVGVRLPHYLGLDINNVYSKGVKHVVFLDSYDAMIKKLRNKTVEERPDDWLMELIASSKNCLFVVGSREYIKWSEEVDREWGDYLDQHILGSLSNEDADYFLKSVPIKDDKVRKTIVKTSKGLPLYLDLCVEIYKSKEAKGEKITPGDFEMPKNQVVDRFLRHLPQERDAIRVLSVVNFFNFELFEYLLKSFNIGYPATKFSDFVKRAFISEIDEDNKLYKIHEVVRSYIVETLDKNLRDKVIKDTLTFFSVDKDKHKIELLKRYFGQILSLTNLLSSLDVPDVENILSIGFYLIDNGLWMEVGEAINRVPEETKLKSELLRNGLNVLYGVYLRRIGKLEEAYEILSCVNYDSLGRYKILAEFHKANVVRLLGNYTKAEKLYENLAKEVSEKRNEKGKEFVKINRQWADLLFLRGKFKKSIGVLEDLLKRTEDELEKAETLRIVGHVYRFNMMIDDAEKFYRKSMGVADRLDVVGLKGKLYTNLTETLCWKNPNEAIKWGEKSLKLNKKLKSQIEVGKTLTALSIAHLMQGDVERAERLAEESERIQSEVGYMSGVLFAKVAKAFIQIRKGNSNLLVKEKEQIDSRIESLQVYGFLELPIYLYLKQDNDITSLRQEIEWLNFPVTLQAFKDVIHKLQNKPLLE